MGRLIKFRAWDKEGKEYLHDLMYSSDCDQIVCFFDGELNSMMRVMAHKFIIEQYTGLKDKNGKESYFNDNFRMCGSVNVYTIIFKYGAFGYISKISGDFVTMHHLFCANLEFEIIGNIHEEKS